MHVESNAPAGANVTFRTLGFKAHPYLMPKDTIVNKAAAEVSCPCCCQVQSCNMPSERQLFRQGRATTAHGTQEVLLTVFVHPKQDTSGPRGHALLVIVATNDD